MVQVNQATSQLIQVTGGVDSVLYGRGWMFGVLTAVVVAFIIIGGIKSIARVTDKIVPLMVGVYIAAALVVIFANLDAVPTAFARIFSGAFNADAMYGGLVGVLIQGFKRAAFSNEAGIGSASIAHSAAKTDEPVSEGVVSLLEPFIDTVVICTMTALIIIVSGEYLQPGPDGVALTSDAFASVFAWFPYVLTVVVFLFAYSTMITWAYYGSKAIGYLTGESTLAQNLFKLAFLAMTVVGCSMQLGSIVGIADALLLLMSVPNLIGVYLLMPVVRRELESYLARLRSGEIRPTTRPPRE